MATSDTVRDSFRQILGADPTVDEVAYWTARCEAANDPGAAIEDMVETLLLRANDVRSLLRLHMCFFDRPPDDGQLRTWTDRYAENRRSDPQLTDREALTLTVRQWLASHRNPAPNFCEEDFRSILLLKLLL